jgi:hypothetical protein
MKYFTPERWLRLQDTSDDTTWLAAYQDWESSVAAYWQGVKGLLTRLPKTGVGAGLRSFVRHGSLHDALVTACWREGSSKLKLQALPEVPGEELVLLEYALASEPVIVPDRLPPEYRTDYLQWMYDELGELPDAGPRVRSRSHARVGSRSGTNRDDAVVFTHNILLSNGWEMEIAFSRFKVTRHKAIWPARQEATLPSLPRTG